MDLQLHPDFRVQKLTIGCEGALLLVIDNFVSDPECLVEQAAETSFGYGGRYYPGIRARAPLQYESFFLEKMGQLLSDCFGLNGRKLSIAMCQYSLVTKPSQNLEWVQRIPHIDTVQPTTLASIHYLFQKPLGGTAFYRHKSTGFEAVDASRQQRYFATLQNEAKDPRFSGVGYINGNTPFFDQIHVEDGVFNRMLIYRSNSLHSGSIDRDFIPDSSVRSGRLSINSFIEAA